MSRIAILPLLPVVATPAAISLATGSARRLVHTVTKRTEDQSISSCYRRPSFLFDDDDDDGDVDDDDDDDDGMGEEEHQVSLQRSF